MLALMKTHHTEQTAEILLQLPPAAVGKVTQAIEKALKSMGHTVRRLNDEGEELYTFDEVFPEAHPGMILRGYRNLEDMTQEALAEHLGIQQHRVSELESGKRAISVKMARKLGQIFGTSHKTFL